jgi:hypothetical protein
VVISFIASVLVQEQMYYWAIVPAFVSVVLVATSTVLAYERTWHLDDSGAVVASQRRRIISENDSFVVKGQLDGFIATLQTPPEIDLHATVHLVVRRPKCDCKRTDPGLIQICQYASTGQCDGGPPFRVSSIYQGLIGRCFRSGKLHTVNFASLAEYERRMVQEFGFTPDSAKRHDGSGRSYLAAPISAGTEIIGVLFLYTTQRTARAPLVYFPDDPAQFPDVGRIEAVCRTLSPMLSRR